MAVAFTRATASAVFEALCEAKMQFWNPRSGLAAGRGRAVHVDENLRDQRAAKQRIDDVAVEEPVAEAAIVLTGHALADVPHRNQRNDPGVMSA